MPELKQEQPNIQAEMTDSTVLHDVVPESKSIVFVAKQDQPDENRLVCDLCQQYVDKPAFNLALSCGGMAHGEPWWGDGSGAISRRIVQMSFV